MAFSWTATCDRGDLSLWRIKWFPKVMWKVFLILPTVFADKVLQQTADIAMLSCASRGEKHLEAPNENAIMLRQMSPGFWSSCPHSHGCSMHSFPTQACSHTTSQAACCCWRWLICFSFLLRFCQVPPAENQICMSSLLFIQLTKHKQHVSASSLWKLSTLSLLSLPALFFSNLTVEY